MSPRHTCITCAHFKKLSNEEGLCMKHTPPETIPLHRGDLVVGTGTLSEITLHSNAPTDCCQFWLRSHWPPDLKKQGDVTKKETKRDVTPMLATPADSNITTPRCQARAQKNRVTSPRRAPKETSPSYASTNRSITRSDM